MPARLFASLDIGSTTIKCVVVSVSASGAPGTSERVEVIASAPTPIVRPLPNVAEIDAAAVLRISERLLAALFRKARARGAIVEAIALTGQVGGLICTDERGVVVAPCATWEDARCTAESATFFRTFAGRIDDVLGVGIPGGVCWPAPKARWLARHMPRALNHTRRVMQIKDFLFFHLTGRHWSEAVTFIGMADVRRARFDDAVVRWTGLPADVLPELHAADDWAPLLPSWRKIFGAPATRDVRLVIGTADMMSSFLGFDLSRGEGFLLAGTAEIIGAVLAPSPHGRGRGDGSGSSSKNTRKSGANACAPAPTPLHKEREPDASVPNRVLRLPYKPQLDIVYGSTTDGAGTMTWMEKLLGRSDWPALTKLAAAAPAGCDGLLLVPHLSGARAPLWRADLRGRLVGLRLHHDAGHMIRAAMEGCAFSKRHVLSALGGGGSGSFSQSARGPGAPHVIKAAGGTARNELWNRIRASVLGVPLRVLECPEMSAIGALILAARREQPELAASIAASQPAHTVEPDERWRKTYDADFAHYVALANDG